MPPDNTSPASASTSLARMQIMAVLAAPSGPIKLVIWAGR